MTTTTKVIVIFEMVVQIERMRTMTHVDWRGQQRQTYASSRRVSSVRSFFSPIFLFNTCGCVVRVYETQPMRNSVVF